LTRRKHLAGIFYHCSSQAGARRIAKTVQEAVEFAERSAAGREEGLGRRGKIQL